MRVKAYAKINLFLEIGAKRPDGYHDIESVMQSVLLCDELDIRLVPSENSRVILTSCTSPELIAGGDNLAVRGAELVLNSENISAIAEIKLNKSIPIAAGLGGGSADAAAAVRGSCELVGVNAQKYEIISAMLGADVPFCINGGCAISKGIGEVLTPLTCCDFYVTIAVAKTKLSTKEQYRRLDIARAGVLRRARSSDGMADAIAHGDVRDVAAELYNAFEEIGDFDEDTKAKLIRYGALGAITSGSGPAVFGLFDSREGAEYAERKLRAGGVFAKATRFYPRGSEIIGL